MSTNKRHTIYPILHPDLWERYKNLRTQVWQVSGADFSNDNWGSLTPNQQNHLKLNLAFFAVSDSVVADNLAQKFAALEEDIIPKEAQFFYAYQLDNECVHSEMYSIIINEYFKTERERNELFNAATQIPAVSKKVNWANKWLESNNFEERLIAFAAVEGILFSSVFSTIFYYKSLHKPLDGLYWANQEISRDEFCHYEFATHLYNSRFKGNLSNSRITNILLEACEVEKEFVRNCFEFRPEGFIETDMLNYVEYVTDTLLINFGCQPYYNAKPNMVNEVMKGIATPMRENFFETRTTKYSQLTDTKFEITDDF